MVTGGNQWLLFVSTPVRGCEEYAVRICTLAHRGEIFDDAILKIRIFDLFQILVAKTYENDLEIVEHIKIDEFAVRLVFS